MNATIANFLLSPEDLVKVISRRARNRYLRAGGEIVNFQTSMAQAKEYMARLREAHTGVR